MLSFSVYSLGCVEENVKKIPITCDLREVRKQRNYRYECLEKWGAWDEDIHPKYQWKTGWSVINQYS